MGIFRRRATKADNVRLVEIPVGADRFAASALAARCEASGIEVQLLTMDEHGMEPRAALLADHRLLVREEDRDRVLRIVRRM